MVKAVCCYAPFLRFLNLLMVKNKIIKELRLVRAVIPLSFLLMFLTTLMVKNNRTIKELRLVKVEWYDTAGLLNVLNKALYILDINLKREHKRPV